MSIFFEILAFFQIISDIILYKTCISVRSIGRDISNPSRYASDGKTGISFVMSTQLGAGGHNRGLTKEDEGANVNAL